MSPGTLQDGDWVAFEVAVSERTLTYAVGRIVIPQSPGEANGAIDWPLYVGTTYVCPIVSQPGYQVRPVVEAYGGELEFLTELLDCEVMPIRNEHLPFIMALVTHEKHEFRAAGLEALALISEPP